MDKPNSQEQFDTETRILRAARQVFFKQGMAGARMQDIADQAGVNKALLHYYFRSKDKLFQTIFTQAFQTMLESFKAIIASPMSITEKLESFIHVYISNMRLNPYLPLFIITEINKRPEVFPRQLVPEHQQVDLKKLFAQIQKEIAEGRIAPFQPMHLIMNVLGMSIFSFIAKPMMIHMLGVNEKQYEHFLNEREAQIIAFVRSALKTS
ncbi:MAG: TetR/AcrR family transcriptional regulator [Saprospiraceae bacterium]|nr:TetR/AcrR family transcriptional regulator [Saprospiraceae bacterium]